MTRQQNDEELSPDEQEELADMLGMPSGPGVDRFFVYVPIDIMISDKYPPKQRQDIIKQHSNYYFHFLGILEEDTVGNSEASRKGSKPPKRAVPNTLRDPSMNASGTLIDHLALDYPWPYFRMGSINQPAEWISALRSAEHQAAIGHLAKASGSEIVLQLWYQAAFRQGCPVYGQIRWNPTDGRRIDILGIERSVIPKRDVGYALTGLELLQKGINQGRPYGTVKPVAGGGGTTAQHVVTIMKARLEQGNGGKISRQEVAKFLQVSTKTLRTRLEDEGSSFEDCLEQAMRESAP